MLDIIITKKLKISSYSSSYVRQNRIWRKLLNMVKRYKNTADETLYIKKGAHIYKVKILEMQET